MKKLITISLILILSSCSLEKRCTKLSNRIQRLCPIKVTKVDTDSSNTFTSIVYKEIPKWHTIPADTSYIQSLVSQKEKTILKNRVKIVYKIEKDSIFITAICLEDSLLTVNSELIKERNLYKKRFSEELKKEETKSNTKFAIFCIWFFWIVLVIIILSILFFTFFKTHLD